MIVSHNNRERQPVCLKVHPTDDLGGLRGGSPHQEAFRAHEHLRQGINRESPSPEIVSLGHAALFDWYTGLLSDRVFSLPSSGQIPQREVPFLDRLPSKLDSVLEEFQLRLETVTDNAQTQLSGLRRDQFLFRIGDLEHRAGNFISRFRMIAEHIAEYGQQPHMMKEFFDSFLQKPPVRKGEFVHFAIRALGVTGQESVSEICQNAFEQAVAEYRLDRFSPITFTFKAGGAAERIPPHASTVFSIVQETVRNAVEHLSPREAGSLAITIREGVDSFQYEITNSGVIHPDFRERVFDIGFSTKIGQSKSISGHQGRGLALARREARLLGGDLVLSVNDEDRTTTFSLALPFEERGVIGDFHISPAACISFFQEKATRRAVLRHSAHPEVVQ